MNRAAKRQKAREDAHSRKNLVERLVDMVLTDNGYSQDNPLIAPNNQDAAASLRHMALNWLRKPGNMKRLRDASGAEDDFDFLGILVAKRIIDMDEVADMLWRKFPNLPKCEMDKVLPQIEAIANQRKETEGEPWSINFRRMRMRVTQDLA